nr:MAG TPA: hypothetical protein [Caudoviricetes sp.]
MVTLYRCKLAYSYLTNRYYISYCGGPNFVTSWNDFRVNLFIVK